MGMAQRFGSITITEMKCGQCGKKLKTIKQANSHLLKHLKEQKKSKRG